jgi:hypothetical protein
MTHVKVNTTDSTTDPLMCSKQVSNAHALRTPLQTPKHGAAIAMDGGMAGTACYTQAVNRQEGEGTGATPPPTSQLPQ